MISSLDVKDKENDVRVLELEVRELELNDRITQLKAEQLIDEGCVGCCKVVDIDKEEIDRLKVELSTRKQDSEVLKKVVDVAHRWSDERIASRPAMNQIAYIVKDYHDAQEEPPETSIDETQDITVTFAFLELP
jgi:hypothetical protein